MKDESLSIPVGQASRLSDNSARGEASKFKRIIWLISILIPFVLGISTSTPALDEHFRQHEMKFVKMLDFFREHKDELGLSKEQVEKLKLIRNAFLRKTASARVELKIASEDLFDLLKEDKIDVSEVEAKVKRIASLGSEVGINFIEALAKQKEILTKEQLERAKRVHEKLPKRCGGCRERVQRRSPSGKD